MILDLNQGVTEKRVALGCYDASSVSSARVLRFFGYFGNRKGYRIKPNKTSVRFGSEPVNSVCKSCRRTSSTSKSISTSTSRNQNPLQNFVKYLTSIQVNRLDC